MATSAAPKVNQPPGKEKSSYSPRFWHRIRKKVHLACFLIFVFLPFFNVMRFDIPKQRFYFLGYELWISEFAIIFFSLMFLMFLIAAISMLYGRVYCGYLCPQMIFSEAFAGLEERIRKFVNKKVIRWKKGTRNILSSVIFYSVLWICSVFLAFVFVSYFIEPRDLLSRLLTLDIVSAGGIAGAATTVVTFLDFAFVRQTFCKNVCPYGYLQGILSDKRTLLVEYRDGSNECIECKKCVRICPMDIDIRNGAHQIECIHCAECVDACEDVLIRLNKPGLIHYSWGEQAEDSLKQKQTWIYRIGLRDTKRFVVLAVLLFYATGLMVALSMRHPVLVQVSPARVELYRVGESGEIFNRFRVKVANRGSEKAFVTISLQDLRGARLVLADGPLEVEPGEVSERFFDIAAHPDGPSPGVNHFKINTEAMPDRTTNSFGMTFIMPLKEESP